MSIVYLSRILFENSTSFVTIQYPLKKYNQLISNVEEEFNSKTLEDYLWDEEHEWREDTRRSEEYNKRYPNNYQMKPQPLEEKLQYAKETYEEVTSGEFRKKFTFENLFKHRINETQKFKIIIEDIISKMPMWHGSRVIISPSINLDTKDYSYGSNDAYSRFSSIVPEDYYEDEPKNNGGSVEVSVGQKNAYFAVWTDDYQKFDLGDLMETIGTDEHEEFFTNDEESQDYYNLAKYIKNPRALTQTKVITVWTARPRRDRATFENTHEIPKGIFVTTKHSSALGIAQDFGSGDKEQTERDVYQIRIEDKYLLVTNDAIGETWYQVVGNTDRIPVKSIRLW